MFDPSKLDLDLEKNKKKKDIPFTNKTESEKIEEHTNESHNDIQPLNIDNSPKDDLEELLNTPKVLEIEDTVTSPVVEDNSIKSAVQDSSSTQS